MFNGHGLYTEEGWDSGQRYQLENDPLSLRVSPSMCTAKILSPYIDPVRPSHERDSLDVLGGQRKEMFLH